MTSKLDRRNFLKLAGIAGAGSLAFGCSQQMQLRKNEISEGPLIRDVVKVIDANETGNMRLQIRSEILENPRAVFIVQTSVKTIKRYKRFLRHGRTTA